MLSPLERRIRLTLQYDGVGFYGWQRQPNLRTVQSELEAALSRLTDRPTTVIGAGRTDRGVHALGQVAAATVPAKWTAAELRRALNAVLPTDIWVVDALEVALDFHPRFDAISRSYLYRVGTADSAASPFRRRWCWPLREPLDRVVLDEVTAELLGEHSFLAFARSGQEERGDRCTIFAARWVAWDEVGVSFEITANRFLHHMVRYLVGTIVDTARGRRPAEDVAGLLAGSPGLETSPPAPPEGLFLKSVAYTQSDIEPEESIDEDLS